MWWLQAILLATPELQTNRKQHLLPASQATNKYMLAGRIARAPRFIVYSRNHRHLGRTRSEPGPPECSRVGVSNSASATAYNLSSSTFLLLISSHVARSLWCSNATQILRKTHKNSRSFDVHQRPLCVYYDSFRPSRTPIVEQLKAPPAGSVRKLVAGNHCRSGARQLSP